MAQFSDDWLDKVKQAHSIVDIVGKKIDLKPSGQNFLGLCPFHEEKTPSFSVNTQNQFYYCFGCGSGGNIFNWIMRTENLSFPDAVEVLAKEANIPMPKMSEKEQRMAEKHEQLYHVNYLAAQYYYKSLRSQTGATARRYLVDRGINGELAKQFYLGLSSAQWDGLLSFFQRNGIEESLAVEAGLIVKGKKGYYDRFRERIMFPICDYRGRFLGFGGRLYGQGQPKYLNTQETTIFHKSKNLYGLNWAKDAIAKQDSVVVVEGYTDCIGLYEKSIHNVVASLGTAFTQYHAQLLARFTKNIIIAFDGDAAGAKAIKRGLTLLRKEGLLVRVAPLESGDDPDTFAGSHSEEEVQSWLTKALPLVEYLIRTEIAAHNLQEREGKLAACKEVIQILQQLDSSVEQSEYSKFAANLLDIEPSTILTEVQKGTSDRDSKEIVSNRGKNLHIIPQNRYTIKDLRSNTIPVGPVNPNELVERNVLRWILRNPSLTEDLASTHIGPDQFENYDYRHLFSLIIKGTWDKHGEEVAEQLFTSKEPVGTWTEYFGQFRAVVWSRALKKIEEKLASMEKLITTDVHLELSTLLKQYYSIRKDIFLARVKKNK